MSRAAALVAAIEAALRLPALAGAHTGILALDAQSGRVLFARNADDDFVPASTLKLIVGSVALARLGEDANLTTGVWATNSPTGGSLDGDLVLRGGGDAQLTLAGLDAAATAVAAAGIRTVSGSLVADASRYDAPRYPPGWTVDDLPYGYAAVPSALSLNLNVARVRVRPGAAAGEPVVLDASPSYGTFVFRNDATTGPSGTSDTTDLMRPWDRPGTIGITGTYPLGAPASDDLEPALPDPPAYAAAAFASSLAAHGVTIVQGVRPGMLPPAAQSLWTHHSKPLRALLRDFWQPSTNVIGEGLLEELGAVSHSRQGDARSRGLAVEDAWLRSIGVPPETLTLVDGSGLSVYDRATPRALAAVLLADWQSPMRATVLAALPVSGESGTLASTFARPPLRGAVIAKTGSENHARALAGYLRGTGGRTLVFALTIDDWRDGAADAQRKLDAARSAILEALLAA